MNRIRSNREIIRPRFSTMPRNKSEASSQLELYKLVAEQERIKQELAFMEQRTMLLKQRLSTIKSQIEETETLISNLRHPESQPAEQASPKVSLEPEPNNYETVEIEY